MGCAGYDQTELYCGVLKLNFWRFGLPLTKGSGGRGVR